ncbi:hypothetical protein I7I51_03835 [Histoplasma capsulatum]|uniref:Uncharacterized protein n=1 Tax=Ajellomyces capsulatus TaxID=5037 RepID=A0A8A1M5B3_AJECA|nr:hypothetical protein I7I51_03835 [Histoplasma capsulatum]
MLLNEALTFQDFMNLRCIKLLFANASIFSAGGRPRSINARVDHWRVLTGFDCFAAPTSDWVTKQLVYDPSLRGTQGSFELASSRVKSATQIIRCDILKEKSPQLNVGQESLLSMKL